MTGDVAADVFEPQRSRLFGLAYRMLGSRADADDVLQDAFLRFQGAQGVEVREPAAYLATIVTRLCLDRLKSASRRRETYVGPWLPEPLLAPEAPATADREVELAEDLSFALMLTLQRLSPPERAAFLLHDVFGCDFAGIATALQREPAACRKLAQRAREHVQRERPRFVIDKDAEERLSKAFFEAAAGGDLETLTSILTEDAVLISDGGGKRRSALKPIVGRDRVARFLVGVRRKASYEMPESMLVARVNQLPGVIFKYPSGAVDVTGIEVRDGRIARVYAVRNPDKLVRITAAVSP